MANAPRVTKGTKDFKGYRVLKGPSDTRQIRCARCKGLAIQAPNGNGGFLYRCTGCGQQYTSQAI